MCHAGSIVHPMWDHWGRRPAELAGTAVAREPDRGAMAVSPQRRALRLVAARGHRGDHAGAWLHRRGAPGFSGVPAVDRLRIAPGRGWARRPAGRKSCLSGHAVTAIASIAGM